ncbi:VCBS repeat-containing protein [Limnovirga soli]|uniref:CRTAC1 family protein n=1 Tax=Limnovirga soli TaxID=2656915 RepID=A0A8J8JS95_9BACT|nr:VCBS repeat-containing protein [Limnovirga soli]NNV53825.1 CRTAC1 family protein [Limnovirga soli]
MLPFFLFTACKNEEQPPALFELQQNSGINFTNEVHNTNDFNIFSYRNFYNGGGAAIGDINNDGLADVFFTANMGSNKLFLNKGNFKFDDISAKAGFTNKQDWSTGVVMVDINHDGWLDIFVCNAGYVNGKLPKCQLFINNHQLGFTDSAAQYGLTNPGGYTTHAAFFDYDLDGDLDCYILNNSFIPVNTLNYANKRNLRAENWPVADFVKGGGDHLLRNDNGHFTDVSEQAGIYGSLIGFGLGITVGDINGDHYPDLYVSNDFFEKDYVYVNQQNGTFKEEGENWIGHMSLASMGADMGDINNDGFPDIFTTDMLPSDEYRLKTTSSFDNIDVERLKEKSGFYYQYMQNTLQLNNQHGKFLEIANYSGVNASDWSWGALMFDADNDGLNDIYVCNGINHDVTNQDFIDFFADDVVQKMVMTGKKEAVDDIINKMPSQPIPNKAFRNNGNLTFSDEGNNWGFSQPSLSNGAAYGDLDNDGDLDLVVNNENEPAFVYRNQSRENNKHHYLGVQLKGKGNNTFAIGSKIELYKGSQIQSREVIPNHGFQSSVDYKIIFGTGDNTAADSLVIIWPDLTQTTITHPATDSVYTISWANNSFPLVAPKTVIPATIFTAVPANFEKHTEDDYIDFYYEPGLMEMLSRQGPKASTGDVNGDGLEDIFIAGAANQASQLYLQQANGSFLKSEQSVFKQFADFEDVAVLLFDCDKDGDLDIFAGAGGNNAPAGSRLMQSRLYKNDGKGNFAVDTKAIPNSGMNTSVVIANDIDGDGDIDLFAGSKSVPQLYGVSPSSFIYLNDGTGRFTDMAKTKNPDIATIGMVSAAVFADVTGDARKELIITGQWMPTRIFTFAKDHFEEVKSNLNDRSGWWQAIAAADLNGDGKQDLVLGNIGENFYLRPSATAPAKLFLKDFDNNGELEKIVTRTVNGKDATILMKRDITDQLPYLKKENLKHEDYAKKSMQDLFTTDQLKNATVKLFNDDASCIAINMGNGQFEIQPLPANVQFSSVNAILCTDVNSDGIPDLIMGGNDFCFQPQFGRLDASFTHVLINNGKAQFSYVPNAVSGIELRGQVRDIQPVKNKNGKYLLMLQNGEMPVLYAFNKRPFTAAGK